MAITLIAQYTAATGDQTFQQKVHMAMLQTCVNTKDEVSTTTNHANRMLLMKAVTNNPLQYAPIFAFLCAAEAIDGTSSDVAIQAMCATVFNAVAGMP